MLWQRSQLVALVTGIGCLKLVFVTWSGRQLIGVKSASSLSFPSSYQKDNGSTYKSDGVLNGRAPREDGSYPEVYFPG
jgi:hypothetical protein